MKAQRGRFNLFIEKKWNLSITVQNDYFYDFENVCEDGLSDANKFLLISF